ncbi:SRPBCC family protein [Nocardioides sp.]|uniref:SRPBCC family protein n=1 Tax=Nocardioides sp. TaxID=35761 RepID=UPI002ED8F0C1
MALSLEHSRTFPVDVERAFDVLLPTPLPELFTRRYAAIPAIREVRDQQGPWGTVGQTRTIVLADGGTLRETLTSVDRPRAFGYRITDPTGPMKPLVTEVEGAWRFDPAGTGVRISWAWTVHPRGVPGRLVMPVFARMWQGYARRAMQQIEWLLVP